MDRPVVHSSMPPPAPGWGRGATCGSRHALRRRRVAMMATAVAVAIIMGAGIPARSAEQPGLEYQVKAGFCYKFLFFTEWPAETLAESDRTPVVIGIIGDNPFGQAFESIVGEEIDGHPLEVTNLEVDAPDEQLRRCHLLYVSSSLDEEVEALLERLDRAPVVTVSDIEGFGERGGMVAFVVRQQRVRFQINTDAAERAGIRFRSRLLRLADRIIEGAEISNNGH